MAIETIGADLTNTRGTTVAPSATAHTKGSWVELVAASAADAQAILVVISSYASSSQTAGYLIDIGIGGSGSEAVAIANLTNAGPAARLATPFYIPLPIPAGTRVSARCQFGGTSGGAITVLAYLLPPQTVDLQRVTNVVTYGAVAGSTAGTSVDPGTTANTKGSWTQIAAATSRNIDWLVPLADNLGQTSRITCEWLVDLGVGGSGSEVAVVSNLEFQVHSTLELNVPRAYPAIPVPRIASGSRLAARAQCSINTTTARLLGVILIGCDGTPAAAGEGIGAVIGGSLVR